MKGSGREDKLNKEILTSVNLILSLAYTDLAIDVQARCFF